MQLWKDPHIADIEAEIRWEMEGIERGAKRIRDAMMDQKFADTDTGQKIIRRLAPPLVRAIKAAQEEAKEGLVNAKRGPPFAWWWLISMFNAEQLAVITLKTVFGSETRTFTFNIPAVALASAISHKAQLQLDFETWKAEQGEAEENQFERYIRSFKEINERTFKRFSERIQRTRLEKWDKKAGIIFGAKLIDLLVEAAPDWFKVGTFRLKGGRTEAQLEWSDEARNTMGELIERDELSRPMFLPMIIPPADWRVAA